MAIRFERVLAQAEVMVVNKYNRTNGTFVQFEVSNLVIPLKKEFKKVWNDVHADWMKVTVGDKTSIVKVICLISKDAFKGRFPDAVNQAENFKLHQKFKNNRRFGGAYHSSHKKGRSAYA